LQQPSRGDVSQRQPDAVGSAVLDFDTSSGEHLMTNQELLDGVRRQLDLLGNRADRLNPGSRRDTLIAKMERLLTQYTLVVSVASPPTAQQHEPLT
jgi:hypothetical protein